MALEIPAEHYAKVYAAREAAELENKLNDFSEVVGGFGRVLGGAYFNKSTGDVLHVTKYSLRNAKVVIANTDVASITGSTGPGKLFWTWDCFVKVVACDYRSGTWLEVSSVSAGVQYLDWGRNRRLVKNILSGIEKILRY